MNNYVKSILDGGAFRARLIFNIQGSLASTECKIDTGCTVSVVTVRRMFGEDVAKALKQMDIDNNVAYKVSYGVSNTENDRAIDAALINSGMLMKCTALKFEHTNNPLILSGYNLGYQTIHFNYDRTGNTLIGTDILSQMDLHTGIDRRTGKYTLIGCLRDRITEDYLNELYEAFAIAFNPIDFSNNPYIHLVGK